MKQNQYNLGQLSGLTYLESTPTTLSRGLRNKCGVVAVVVKPVRAATNLTIKMSQGVELARHVNDLSGNSFGLHISELRDELQGCL